MFRSKIFLVILLLLSVATMVSGGTYSEQYIWNSVFDRSAGAAVLYAITGYVPGPHGNTSYSTNWILNQIYDPANKALRSGVVGGSDTTLRGRLVGDVTPLSGEVLGWNGSAWVPMTGVPADSAAYAFAAGISDTASFAWKSDTANASLWSLRVGKNPMADPYQDNVWYTYIEALPDTGASPDTTLLIRSVMRSGGSSDIVDAGWFDRNGYHGNLMGNYVKSDSSSSDSLFFPVATIEPYGYIWGADAGGNLKSWLQLDYGDGYASLGVVNGFDYMTENGTWIFEWDTLGNTYYNTRSGNKNGLTQFNNKTTFGWRSVSYSLKAPYYSIKIKYPADSTEFRVNRDSVIVGGDGDFFSFNHSYLNGLDLAAEDGSVITSSDSILFTSGGPYPNRVKKGSISSLFKPLIVGFPRTLPSEHTIDTIIVLSITPQNQVQSAWQGIIIPNKPLTTLLVADSIFVYIDVSDTAKAITEGYTIWYK